MSGKPFDRVAIYGFDLNTNKFQSAAINSFRNYVFRLAPGENFSVLDGYEAGSQQWGWRTEIDIVVTVLTFRRTAMRRGQPRRDIDAGNN